MRKLTMITDKRNGAKPFINKNDIILIGNHKSAPFQISLSRFWHPIPLPVDNNAGEQHFITTLRLPVSLARRARGNIRL